MLQELDWNLADDLKRTQPVCVQRQLEQKPHKHLHQLLSRLHRQTLASRQTKPSHELHFGRISCRRSVESSLQFDIRSYRLQWRNIVLQLESQREQRSEKGQLDVVSQDSQPERQPRVAPDTHVVQRGVADHAGFR